jgi:hypothetical protein
MLEKAPFNEQEHKIWNNLGYLAGAFSKLEPTHPSDRQDVVNAIHQLQDVLGRRGMRRAFPGSFASYTPTPNGWARKEVDNGKTND